MRPVEFEQQTLLLGPPKDALRGACGALPVMVQDDAIQSFWKPTPEDIEALKNGGHVRLCVFSVSHPPVWVDAVPSGYVAELP